jgi:hypothetical protein
VGLDDLKELNDFSEFREFIKNFIMEDRNLFRVVYFPYSDPFDEDKCPMPDRRLSIFDGSKIQQRDGNNAVDNIHGVVLFRRRYDDVINSEIPVVLVDFHSAKVGNSKFIDDVFITFRIICKGVNIQELANGLNRSAVIADLIDNQFNFAMFSKISEVTNETYKEISINEENSGYLLTYRCRNLAHHLTKNVNYLERNYGVSNYENI